MALRPFSLLLLLVMIPAITMLPDKEFTPTFICESSAWFCFPFWQEHEKQSSLYIERSTKEAYIRSGGFVLDTYNPREWVFTFSWGWDYRSPDDGCSFKFMYGQGKPRKSLHIACSDVIKSRKENLPGLTGLQIIPSRSYESGHIFEVKLKADPGLFVPDVFELYAMKDFKLIIWKKLQHWGGKDNGESWAESANFYPYTCSNPNFESTLEDGANLAEKTDCLYSCEMFPGSTLFLEGTNTEKKEVYSSAGGWKDLTKNDLLKQEYNKWWPLCWNDKMFERCLKNRCFVFGDSLKVPQSNDVLVKADKPDEIKTKLGAYVVYSEDDKSWTLQLEYKNLELISFTIGDEKYEIRTAKAKETITGKKITATVTRTGRELLTGRTSKKYMLQANQDQQTKELTELFGFYGGAKNVLKLTFAKKSYEVAGVANHKEYKPTGTTTLKNAIPIAQPDVDNMFKCKGVDESIYLNDVKMNLKELRFTTKGWLHPEGTLATKIPINNGKEEVAVVNCYSVCQNTKYTTTGSTQPVKTLAGSTVEITCDGLYVILNSDKTKLLTSITCQSDTWKADGVTFDVTNGFVLECFGENKLVKGCTLNEKERDGCATVKKVNGKYTCKPGFALIMENNGKLEKKIYESISLQTAGSRWMDGTTDIGLADGILLKPVCYSKCALINVLINLPDPVPALTAKAEYNYDHEAENGKLKCTDTNVLLANLDGSEKNFVNDLVCDTEGWKDGTTVKKDFKNAKTLDELKVTAKCYKACDDKQVNKECEAGDSTYDCTKAFLSSLELQCAPTYALFVNGKFSSRTLECSKKGWTLRGDDTLVIDFRTNLKDTISAKCFSKCGGKFVSGAAPYSGTGISCPGTDIISYQVDGAAAVDTLEDLTCDKDAGWKAGTQLIAPFGAASTPKIAAYCKPGCSNSLIEANCNGHTDCKAAKYNNGEVTCEGNRFLWADNQVELNAMQCKKKTFESKPPSTAITIARANPTSTAQISCISKCDAWFVEKNPNEKDINEAGKLKITSGTKTEVLCEDAQYYTKMITKKPDGSPNEFIASKFTCDPANGWTGVPPRNVGPLSGGIDGKKLVAGCKNKCDERINALSPILCAADRHCEKVTKDDNKIKCENSTHVLISMDGSNLKGVYGSEELECKKDGFYHKQSLVLKFDGKAFDHKFDTFCVTKCDKLFVEHGIPTDRDGIHEDVFTNVLSRTMPGDQLLCAADQHLIVMNKGKAKRVLDSAVCNAAEGWTDDSSLDPTKFERIVNFPADSFKIQASCMKVCDILVIEKACVTAKTNECSAPDYDGPSSTLSCQANYRLFLNGKHSKEDDSTKIINTMTCSKEGWHAKDETILDFTNSNVDIIKKVTGLCKHKCNTFFVDTKSFLQDCSKGTTCTQAKHDGTKLSCGDPSDSKYTAILVIENNGVRREAWESAECSDAGWKDTKGNVLFKLDSSFNYHVKARCEELCSPNVDDYVDPEGVSHQNFESENKTLTCVDVNQMLAFGGEGVYSDLICSKDGWSVPKKKIVDGKETLIADDQNIKYKITPIIDATENTEKKSRAKKFACVLNDCIRAARCHKSDGLLNCREPDVMKQKYKLTCNAPDKLIKYDASYTRKSVPVYISDLTCVNGEWKSESNESIVPVLSDRNEPIENRTEYPVVCTSEACTKCTDSLNPIESGTDTNIFKATFEAGLYASCSRYLCGSGHFAIQPVEGVQKFTYYRNADSQQFSVKCNMLNDDAPKTYQAPDGESTVTGRLGCVKQIPCNEYSRIDTTCKGLKCEEEAKFDALLEAGSKLDAGPVTCGDLGQMYHETVDNGKTVWKVVKELQCDKRGEWKASIFKAKADGETTEKTLKHTKDNDPAWRVICSIYDPNPEAKQPEFDAKTQTCLACADAANKLKCDDCKSYAASKNDGKGGCVMNIPSGYRFKIDGKKEVSGHLKCQMTNGVYEWKTAEGLKVNTLAVVSHAISTGAIVGIAFGVILVLGLIVFAMVFVAIRRKREQERLEKLKSKGLEQKQDTIIDNVTLVEDSKTLVL